MGAHRVRIGITYDRGLFYVITRLDTDPPAKAAGPFLTEPDAEGAARALSRRLRDEFDASDYDGPDPANRSWHPIGTTS